MPEHALSSVKKTAASMKRAQSETRTPSKQLDLKKQASFSYQDGDGVFVQKTLAPSLSDTCLSNYSGTDDENCILSAVVDSYAHLRGAYSLQADLDILAVFGRESIPEMGRNSDVAYVLIVNVVIHNRSML